MRIRDWSSDVCSSDLWPPEPLAGAGPEREPVGIVDLRAPVHAVRPAALGKPVHRRQRGETEALDRPAQEEVFLHLHYHAFPAGEAEEIGRATRLNSSH